MCMGLSPVGVFRMLLGGMAERWNGEGYCML